jgi:dihydroorotate dehydrogenase
MFFISPPFGNYIELPKTIRIYGSFTLEPRTGLLSQIMKTLRYSFKYHGWVNQIGLRNKGIDWAIENVPHNHVLSVAIMHDSDIPPLLQKIPKHRNIELNVSCPNVVKTSKGEKLGNFINDTRKWCIIKLSPKTTFSQIDHFYHQGFRQFHCSNTVPVPEGGLSGIAVRTYSEKQIAYLREKYPDTELIGGGGITRWNDVLDLQKIGANHFSVSTGFFRPIRIASLYCKYLFNQ